MHLLLTFALAIDLAGIKAEPKLEKRSDLALKYAETAVDTARDSYKKGDMDATQAALHQVMEGVQLSYDSLMATGKDPRRSSGPFKKAEKTTRQILRRLEGLSDFMSASDRGVVGPVRQAVSDIHDKLILGIMGKKK